MMPWKIKLFWRVGAVLAALTAVAVAAAVLVPRMGVSDLYRRYEGNPHLDVTYLRNFPVNDTLSVDVTLLQARDDEGWDTLRADFRIPELPPLFQQQIEDGKDMLSLRFVSKTDLSHTMDSVDMLNNNVIAISRLKRTICIFYTSTIAEQQCIYYNQLEKNITNK